ncbi:DUF4390 domain-containing protein [Dechloromonas sp. ZS-1]|uniref:DUF4390 domain-containing protein n=1 Tax=Dechloromonas sp. ZS-1 TaxID=3138067 RepID=UPI0031FC7611
MAFSTASSRSIAERWRRLLCLLLWLPLLAWAAEIEVNNPQLLASDDGYVLNADFAFDLNARLEEAVTKGVALHFVAEFELGRPRWYWFDDKLVTRTQTVRLAYHALTRQYRVTTGGGLHQSYGTLTEALRAVSRLRNWLVVERGDKAPKSGDTLQAALRIRLDLNQLPRPFQISALGNKDWNLSSDWKIWAATLPALPPLPAPAAAPTPAVETR